MFERATRAATEILGLTEVKNSKPPAGNQFDPPPGPKLPAPRFCAQCGMTASWHKRPLEKLKREDPKFDGHEFQAAAGTE
jgi:hypothetical protein